MANKQGPLTGIRVLDLSRVLAGPSATQMLGDLGADVVKIERPGVGDDTRGWGPPYLKDEAGNETGEAAYYLSTNRNKRSVTVDISKEQGQELVRGLAAKSDVMIENFKVGALARYGLDFETVRADLPELIYCSISGFGQTGPRASEPGYDYLIQAMGGLMSLTGPQEGPPMRAGIAIADVMCGMNAVVAILAALFHRERTHEGQHIDLGLHDTQVGWLFNEALNYFTSGRVPQRLGNGHPNLVPYQLFATADGHVVLAVGNDRQFARYCAFAGMPELAEDSRFATMSARIENRDALVPILENIMLARDSATWIEGLTGLDIPCGPVRDLGEVFDDAQTAAREMAIEMPHPAAGRVRLVGNPIKLSASPVTYRHPPPMLGQHTDEVLAELLELTDEKRRSLRAAHII
ncbi:MAG: CaiB/BaiF CoA-transferase family protein [Alphaproteobacteria bacterium]|nr:CaiB/BaiF CoA-transferase family protein [Alphaproteobacteria bacterium]